MIVKKELYEKMHDIDSEINNIVMEIESVVDNIENEDLEDCSKEIECKYSISMEDFQMIIEGVIMTLGGAYLNTKDKDNYYIIYKGLKITIEYNNTFSMSKKCWYGTYQIDFIED